MTAAVSAAGHRVPPSFDWLKQASARDEIALDGAERSSWAMVSILLVDMIRSGAGPDAARARKWFGLPEDGACWSGAAAALEPLATEQELPDLLPYLLDTFGRTTRLDVIRDTGLGDSRARRKSVGSFYTPSDVADFMVAAIAGPTGEGVAPPDGQAVEWWLDPAAGSGVFLLSALRHAVEAGCEPVSFATTRLTGCDISPQACDFTSFTILAAVSGRVADGMAAWRSIRRNVVAMDAIAPGRSSSGLRSLLSPGAGQLRLICNPPYASSASSVTSMADGRATSSLYLPFVELAWRLADAANDAASLVVPLALGANRSADHRRCRTALSKAGGDWTLLFFDRQPHALFGEEAKTRATIAIRRPGPTPACIRTSAMLKWTSRQRQTIFTEERAADLGQADIGRLVPKLASADEVTLYSIVSRHRLREGARPEPVRASADEIVGQSLSTDVFVAGTAYNFLNVFRNYPDRLTAKGPLSSSGIHRLRCRDRRQADIVTAVLSSRMAFWLWHVECDGFHVPAWFLSELPLLNASLSESAQDHLAELGCVIWEGLQTDLLASLNGGKLTFAFRPTHIGNERTRVDEVLTDEFGAPHGTAAMLTSFEERTVSIDGSTRRARNPARQE